MIKSFFLIIQLIAASLIASNVANGVLLNGNKKHTTSSSVQIKNIVFEKIFLKELPDFQNPVRSIQNPVSPCLLIFEDNRV